MNKYQEIISESKNIFDNKYKYIEIYKKENKRRFFSISEVS